MVKSILLAIAFALPSLAVSASAQTYTQDPTKTNNNNPGEWACQISTDHCSNIPMVSGDTYTFGGSGYGNVWAGQPFSWDGTQGVITSVTTDFCQILNEACSFKFAIKLTTGRTGTVTGTDTMGRVGRWVVYVITNSTVTLN